MGEVFCWSAFTSTTKTKAVGSNFGNVIFEIECNPPKEMLEDNDPEVFTIF